MDKPVQRGPFALIANLATGVAAAALLGLVAVQAWQVFARYVLNASPSWTEPVTLVLLATAMGLGAAAGVHERRHFAFSLVADAAPPAWHAAAELLRRIAIATIGAVMAWWGAQLTVDGWDIPMAGVPLPQGLPYLPLAIGGVLMLLFAVAEGGWSRRGNDQPEAGETE